MPGRECKLNAKGCGYSDQKGSLLATGTIHATIWFIVLAGLHPPCSLRVRSLVRFTPAITAGGRVGRSAAAQLFALEDKTGRQAGKGQQKQD